nr:MAG TPA: hypothetical protein [Caudoviricetes sp.]
MPYSKIITNFAFKQMKNYYGKQTNQRRSQ